MAPPTYHAWGYVDESPIGPYTVYLESAELEASDKGNVFPGELGVMEEKWQIPTNRSNN